MESGDDEDVKDAGFLEGGGFVTIDEAAVAEEHGAERCGGAGIGGGECRFRRGAGLALALSGW